MSHEALMLNVIAHLALPSELVERWCEVFTAAHPNSSENAARLAYDLACKEWEKA